MDKLYFFVILVVVIVGYVLNYFLPAYFGKKGENLATKEDIERITHLTETVQDDFRRGFEDYSKDRSFKYQYYYDQFRELYTKLYSIIAQSEYLRRFFRLHDGSEFDFDVAPFIEIQRGKQKTQMIKIDNKKGTSVVENNIAEIRDELSESNKIAMAQMIIEKGEYASKKLLKLAVAYRFVHKHYAGTDPTSDAVETANDEETLLIEEIIISVVKEYNFLRRELKLDYIESELKTGMFDNISIIRGES